MHYDYSTLKLITSKLEIMRRLNPLTMIPRLARRALLIVLSIVVILLLIRTAIQGSSDSPSTIPRDIHDKTATRPMTMNEVPKVVIRKRVKTSDKQAEAFIRQPPPNTVVLRGLLLFFPEDQANDFLLELRWFYRSWIEMLKFESVFWRTDLIIFSKELSPLFKDLGCVFDQIRENSTEPAKCRVFPYVRVKNRNAKHEPSSRHQVIDKKRSESLFHHLKGYGYIDSINTVLEYSNAYSMYHYVLRTDMDCFLTANFARYVPLNNTLIVGRGGYSTDFNQKRLQRIARDMGWDYSDDRGLGSTWYGPPAMTYRVANFTIDAMVHLSSTEFATPERENKLGVMMWPEWHYGVLLLYGGHLAINHLVAVEGFDIGLASELLDQGVTATDQTDIRRNVRLHLHCWHGDNPFSKFAFKVGKYDAINSTTLLNDTSASGYAMRLALEAKAMSPIQLREMFLNLTKNSSTSVVTK